MKKNLLLGLLMLALLALPLMTACSEEPVATTEAPAATTEAPAATTEAPAATTEAPAATTEAPAATTETEVFKLTYAMDGMEQSAPCQYTRYFEEYITENTGGRVQFDNYYNGVLGSDTEMLDLISTGSIDMTNMLTGNFKEKLPLHNFPHWQTGSADNALNILQQLYFEVPETAAILEAEQAENNIKILHCHYLGENGITIKEAVTSMDELKGKKLGSSIPQKAWESLGVIYANISPPDIYESLSRGVIDCTPMPLEPCVVFKWYEVAEQFMGCGAYAAGQQMTLNLDTWNSLPDDIKEVFLAASELTVDYSIQHGEELNNQYEQMVEEAGLIVGRFSEEECQNLYSLNYQFQAEEMLEIAAKVGKTAEAEIMMDYCDELMLGQ